MARLVCVLLLSAVAFASASDERIIGGYPSSVEEYPSVVQIQRSLAGLWRQNCAGSILTSKWILTVAGCAVGPEDIIARLRRVLAGTSYRNGVGQYSDVARILKHPYWEEGLNRDGDIALLELWTPLQYTSTVQQGTILGQGAYIPDNLPTTQLGWGMTFSEDFPSIFSPVLKRLDVWTVNNQRCALNYATIGGIPLTVTPNMVCAASVGDDGACFGDRGGPLYADDIIIGLVSWGRGCSNSTFPTVHTAISSFTNWIVANAR